MNRETYRTSTISKLSTNTSEDDWGEWSSTEAATIRSTSTARVNLVSSKAMARDHAENRDNRDKSSGKDSVLHFE